MVLRGEGGPAWELNLQLYPGGERVSCSCVSRALVGLGFQGLGSPKSGLSLSSRL